VTVGKREKGKGKRKREKEKGKRKTRLHSFFLSSFVLTPFLSLSPDPLVRPVRPDELDRYLPAAIAMFTEEVGIDPRIGDGGVGYRSRVAELVAAGREIKREKE